jgi:uncharacterized protein YjbI with pentapeptide repeats
LIQTDPLPSLQVASSELCGKVYWSFIGKGALVGLHPKAVLSMKSDKYRLLIGQGVEVWNAWRNENPKMRPDLRGIDLEQAQLDGYNLAFADLRNANLKDTSLRNAKLFADFKGASLKGADLFQADFTGPIPYGEHIQAEHEYLAYLKGARLANADLSSARLTRAHLTGCDMSFCNLTEATLVAAQLVCADLQHAKLVNADLFQANLMGANLSRANLENVHLNAACLVQCRVKEANFKGAWVYGASVWELNGEPADETGLNVMPMPEYVSSGAVEFEGVDITVDNLRLAQFIYLLTSNKQLRDVIDTMASRVVLILGSFSDKRKRTLDKLRQRIRTYGNYVPLVFDFQKPISRTTGETVSALARMCRFVIADLTDAKSVLQELGSIVPTNTSVPVIPLLAKGYKMPGMIDTFLAYPWFLPIVHYENSASLLRSLDTEVIDAAEKFRSKASRQIQRRLRADPELTA